MNLPTQNDPLGLAVMARAAQNRQQQHLDEMEGDINSRMIGGPLPDPAWDGLLQALQEHHVGKVGQTSASPFGPLPSTFNPAFQQSAAEGMGPSQNIADVQSRGNPSTSIIGGLRDAGPEDGVPGQWAMTKTDIGDPRRRRGPMMPVVDQRGTDPMNNSERFRRPSGQMISDNRQNS